MVAVVHEALTGTEKRAGLAQIHRRGDRSDGGVRKGAGGVPVGEVTGRAGEAAEELLELAEGGVAGDVGGGGVALGELRLVAVEDGALIPA